MKIVTLLALCLIIVPAASGSEFFSSFSKAHAGRHAASLSVTALGDTVHGLVLHDGKCAYSAEKKLGCFDPRSLDQPLGCGRPQVTATGSVWLYLHGVAMAPFDGGPAVYRALPIWAFSHVVAANGRDVYIWGMGEETGVQELWQWNSVEDVVQKIVDGPAELSGGIARLQTVQGEDECLLLTTYKPVDRVCEGMTSVFTFCGDALEKVTEFRGCSSRVAAADDAVFNYQQRGLVKFTGHGSEFLPFRSMHLDSWVPVAGGNPREVLFDGRAVTILSSSTPNQR